jgi:hypothetical protein
MYEVMKILFLYVNRHYIISTVWGSCKEVLYGHVSLQLFIHMKLCLYASSTDYLINMTQGRIMQNMLFIIRIL